jgi:hypothetical protein
MPSLKIYDGTNWVDIAKAHTHDYTFADHSHDDLYYQESEFINTSAGVADAGKPIVLDATGGLSDTMLPDHTHEGSDHTHSIYALTDHSHDDLYYQESEFINTSAGVGDAGKPIVLDSNGMIDDTMIDYTSTGSPADHTHSASDITDFDIEVSNNSDVAANTSASHAESHTVESHSDTTVTGTNLDELAGGGDTTLHTHNYAATDHSHDDLYYQESEYINTSAGVGDAGKPIVLDATGGLSDTMLPDHTHITDAFFNFFNGTILESFDALATSNGTIVTFTVTNQAGGDLTMRFSDGATTLSTPATIDSDTGTVSIGTNSAPVMNYLYITQANKILEVSTSGFPTTEEHIKISTFFLPSATYVQADGPYITQNWNDHIAGTDGQGHLSHIAERSRRDGAYWQSGVDANGTDQLAATSYIDYVSASEAYFKTTAGVIFQMHRHTVDAFDSRVGVGDIHVVNWDGTSYNGIHNLDDIVTDANGVSLINKYYNIVFWGVANKSGEYTPIMCNLPTGSYNNVSDARADLDGYDVLSIPSAFNTESSTGFLICRITLRNLLHLGTIDLRGQTPATASGGASGAVSHFADNNFTIFDADDVARIIDFDAGSIATGNTRTILMADTDVDLADIALNTADSHAESHTVESHSDTTVTGTNLDELAGGGTTTLHTHDYAATDHSHDDLYYQESEYINTSAGVGDAGKPIVLDATGGLSDTMLPDHTHPAQNLTGEVLSTGLDTTIAPNVVDETHLKLPADPINDYVLTADSTESGGMKWALSSSGFADPMTTAGDLIYRTPGNVTARFPVGSGTQTLVSNGDGGIAWEDSTAGSPTTLSIGTVNATTVSITSDGAVDDVTLPAATTNDAGLLTAATFNEIGDNSLKPANVSTALSLGTVDATTVSITSDGATDDVTLVEADTTNAGLLGSDKWDEIVANTSARTGYVVGPADATDGALARYDTTTGKLIQGSNILVDDTGAIVFPANVTFDHIVTVSGSGAQTVDFTLGNKGNLTQTAATTLTLTYPGIGNYMLIVVGTAFTLTWPPALNFPGGTAPSVTDDCLVGIYYDGTDSWATYTESMS